MTGFNGFGFEKTTRCIVGKGRDALLGSMTGGLVGDFAAGESAQKPFGDGVAVGIDGGFDKIIARVWGAGVGSGGDMG